MLHGTSARAKRAWEDVRMRKVLGAASFAALLLAAGTASAQDIKIALLAGRTGPLEAYAKQTKTNKKHRHKYLTKGTMAVGDRKIQILVKDDQNKPDLAKSLLEQAY